MIDQPDEDATEETADAVGVPVDDEPAPDAEAAEEALADDGSATEPASTGHPAVDEVLRSLDGLDGRPVDEHVAAFEEAHERLRRALSNAGDDDTP